MQESLRRGGWVWFCGLLPIAGCASTTGVPNGAAGAGAVLVAPSPTTRHHVDISKLASDLRRLPPGERDEQIADWVVAGTLGLEAPDDPEVLAALSRQPIQRDAQLEVLVPFAQGRGRHVLVGKKRVLLFVSARDGQGRARPSRMGMTAGAMANRPTRSRPHPRAAKRSARREKMKIWPALFTSGAQLMLARARQTHAEPAGFAGSAASRSRNG